MATPCKLYSVNDLDPNTGEPLEGVEGVSLDNVEGIRKFAFENNIDPDELLADIGVKPPVVELPKVETKNREVFATSYMERVKADPAISEQRKEVILQAAESYYRTPDEFGSAQADALLQGAIDTGTVDELYEQASNINLSDVKTQLVDGVDVILNNDDFVVKAMLLSKIANYYAKNGMIAEEAKVKQFMAASSNAAGKFSSAFRMMSHPEAIQSRYLLDSEGLKTAKLNEKNNAKNKKNAEVIDEVQEIANEGIRQATDNTLASEKVKKAIDETIKKEGQTKAQRKKEKIQKEVKAAAEYLKKTLNINTDPDLYQQGLSGAALIDLIADSAIALANTGIAIEDAIKQVIAKLKQGGFISNRTNIDILNQQVSNRISTKTKGKIKEKLQASGLTINQVVKKYYEQSEAIKTNLTNALVDEAGLDIDNAQELAKIIEKTFDGMLSETKAKIEAKLNEDFKDGQAKELKKQKEQLIKKINKVMLSGIVDPQDFRNLFGDYLGFMALDKVDMVKLSEMVRILSMFPEGTDGYYRELQKFNDYIAQFDPKLTKWRILSKMLREMFFTNILGGTVTLGTNVKGLVQTASLGIMADTMWRKDPVLFAKAMKAFGSGLARSKGQFMQILSDGFNSTMASEEGQNTSGYLQKLVNKDFSQHNLVGKAAKAYLWLPTKMTRALLASDAFAKSALRDYYSVIYAYDILKKDYPQKGKEFWDKVQKLANTDKAEYEAYLEQAEQEKANYEAQGIEVAKNFVAIRANELVKLSRAEDMQKFSELMAARATLNNRPEGMFGLVYDVAKKAQGVPLVTEFVLPFIRIPTNQMDNWVSYTPIGFKRGALGRGALAEKIRPFQERAKKELRIGKDFEGWEQDKIYHLSRAVVGTLMGGYIMACIVEAARAAMSDDDKETAWWCRIDNFTSSLSSDYSERATIKQVEGLQPYSVHIKGLGWYDYKASPLAPYFACGGYYMDDKRANKRSDKPEEIDDKQLFLNSLANTMFFVKEQSYIQSMVGLAEALGDSKTSTGGQAVNWATGAGTNWTKRVLYPKTYEDMYKAYKDYNGEAEYRPVKASDNFWQGIYESMAKNVPVIEGVIENKAFDQLGHPIETDASNLIIFVPKMGTDWILGEKKKAADKYDDWAIVTKYNLDINHQAQGEIDGKPMTKDQKTKLNKFVGDYIAKGILEYKDEFEYLSPKERDGIVEALKERAYELGKYKLFKAPLEPIAEDRVNPSGRFKSLKEQISKSNF